MEGGVAMGRTCVARQKTVSFPAHLQLLALKVLSLSSSSTSCRAEVKVSTACSQERAGIHVKFSLRMCAAQEAAPGYGAHLLEEDIPYKLAHAYCAPVPLRTGIDLLQSMLSGSVSCTDVQGAG